MSRSAGSFTLTFGLLNIPVKIYTSAKAESVSFKQMTADGHQVGQKLYDKITNEEISRSSLVKGYEHTKNSFVVFTKDEIESLASSKCDTASIEEFVPLKSFDFMNIEKTYYVGPDKGADKGYLLLAAALKKEKKAAVAKWYSKGREHLITIREHNGNILMHQMFYSSELKNFDNPCAKLPISDQELELASKMIQQASVKSYGPTASDKEERIRLYRDNYIDRVTAAVAVKQDGGTIKVEKKEDVAPVGGDLTDLLKSSLNISKKAS